MARVERGDALRFRFRWLLGSLQWRMGPLPGEAPAAVELLDARTGMLMQRINLDGPFLHGRAWLEAAQTSVSPSAFLWREAKAAPGVSVWWDGKGLLAGLGNKVKALSFAPVEKAGAANGSPSRK